MLDLLQPLPDNNYYIKLESMHTVPLDVPYNGATSRDASFYFPNPRYASPYVDPPRDAPYNVAPQQREAPQYHGAPSREALLFYAAQARDAPNYAVQSRDTPQFAAQPRDAFQYASQSHNGAYHHNEQAQQHQAASLYDFVYGNLPVR